MFICKSGWKNTYIFSLSWFTCLNLSCLFLKRYSFSSPRDWWCIQVGADPSTSSSRWKERLADPSLQSCAFLELVYSGSSIGLNADPDPAFLVNGDPDSDPGFWHHKNRKKINIFFINNWNLLTPRPQSSSKLQEKPLALRREHPALPNLKFFPFSIFALLDPDPARPKSMRIHADPDQKHC